MGSWVRVPYHAYNNKLQQIYRFSKELGIESITANQHNLKMGVFKLKLAKRDHSLVV